MGAVAHVIVGIGAPIHEINPADDLAVGKVGVAGIDAGVDHRDGEIGGAVGIGVAVAVTGQLVVVTRLGDAEGGHRRFPGHRDRVVSLDVRHMRLRGERAHLRRRQTGADSGLAREAGVDGKVAHAAAQPGQVEPGQRLVEQDQHGDRERENDRQPRKHAGGILLGRRLITKSRRSRKTRRLLSEARFVILVFVESS